MKTSGDASPSPQPRPTRKFEPQSGSRYRIEFDGECVELDGPEGLRLIHRLLTSEGIPEYVWTTASGVAVHDEIRVVVLAFDSTSLQEVSDVPLRELNKWLKDGSFTTTDRVRIREYKNATFGAFNRRRKVADEGSRDQDAVRKQLERAIAAIARKAPRCAKFLKQNIVNIGDGAWWFKCNREEWDTGMSEEDLLRGMNEAEQVHFLRELWLVEQVKPAPRRSAHRTHGPISTTSDDETVSHPVSKSPVLHRRCGRRMLDKDEQVTPEGRSKSRGDPVCVCHYSARVRGEKKSYANSSNAASNWGRNGTHATPGGKSIPDIDKSPRFNRPAYTCGGRMRAL